MDTAPIVVGRYLLTLMNYIPMFFLKFSKKRHGRQVAFFCLVSKSDYKNDSFEFLPRKNGLIFYATFNVFDSSCFVRPLPIDTPD